MSTIKIELLSGDTHNKFFMQIMHILFSMRFKIQVTFENIIKLGTNLWGITGMVNGYSHFNVKHV